ncbi:MAG: YwaF family protein [Lachnospiraceae bacterium]|nr:YwaF family protein [uncultured Eubacterium sp.]MCI6537290.1 YwaF family protein [Lachnospiraceae bacterium]
MYTYFFTYQDALPADSGFPLFGRIHLLWLTGIALGIFLLCKVSLRLAETKRLQMLSATVLLALCCTFTQDTILSITGHMNARMLPFHLCDLAAFFYLFLQMRALRTGKWTSLAEITLCLFMPGAVFGILFPVWSIYPAFHYMTIHGFVYHALIMLYPWLLFVQKKIQPKPRHIWQPVLLLCCIVPPVYAFNLKFDSNYMFIHEPPANTPLELLAWYMGNPGYLIGYAIFIFLMMLALYFLFAVLFRIFLSK